MRELLQTLAGVVTEKWFWYLVIYTTLSRLAKSK